jgi:eukaryotic-like serine/threonine-protein kinase
MAQIYLARMDGMASFERHVVLKTILANRANDRRFINMFLDEAKLAATLNHQNIAQVYEIDQADGAYYMAMEYVHGENCRAILETSIRRATVIPIELAVLIVSGAAAGLHHAHERKGKTGQALNIVHRDVSPANIMVGYDGSVKVLDFGIAKAEERYTQTIGSTIKGKYGYMSPEQCKGKGIDRRSDIFALGIVLYELTTQRRAFKGRDDFDTMKRIVAGDLMLPSSLVPGYPPELEGIILKALSSEPDDRYSTAQAMIESLDVFTQRAKLACTNTAMARFMVQLFGEPREPWEMVPVDGRQSSSSSTPALASPVSLDIEELGGHEDMPTTVLPGGSATLPPSSNLIPPRTVTSQGHQMRGGEPTSSAIVRARAASLPTGPASRPQATGNPPYATGSTPPPSRGNSSTTPPPSRGNSSTTPPPSRGNSSTTPPPMRGNSSTTPPPTRGNSSTTPPPSRVGSSPPSRANSPTTPRRALATTGAPGSPAPAGPNELSGRFPLPSPANPPPTSAPALTPRLEHAEWQSSDHPSEVREALEGRLTPSFPSAPSFPSSPASPLTPLPPSGPMFGGKGPTPSQISAPRAAPLMRPTPSAPLSVPLVPRTYTPAALPPPPLGPLLQQRQAAAAAAAEHAHHVRAGSEEGSLRAHSSVMAPLPMAESSAMAPLPRPETMGPEGGEQRFKYRWAIVVVLLVVLAAVGLMITIALTSAPAT